MLLKQQTEQQSKLSRCRRRLRLFSSSRMTYVRMESEERKKKMKEAEAKENCNPVVNKEVKEKKKKRSWKRFRAAALTTCRYIGMGMAHMSPATAYSSPDYHVDPKTWNRSFNSNYNKPRVQQPQTPHWSSNMMYAGW